MKKASELLGKKLVAKVELVRYRFPTAKKDILPGKLSIAVMSLNKVIKGDIPSDFMQSDGTAQFIIKGFNIPVLEIGQEYLMTGNLTQDNRWGYQYNISEIHMDYDLTKVEDQRKMLSYFLTDLQIDLLYQNFDNPAKLLEEKKIGELTKIKGIGPVTALKMCERYVQCRMNGRAYVVFGELGLTKNAIDKIVEHYGSVDLAVDAVEANPYTLIKDVRGYGWNKADEIAQKKGFLKNCKERVQAFAQYYLQEQADVNGFSCISIEDLIANIASECSPITNDTIGLYIKEVTANTDQFDEYMKNHQIGKHEGNHPQFFYNIKTRHIGLFWYRVVEKDIFTEMQRIRNSKNLLEINDDLIKKTIDKCQKQIGFEYTDEQTKAIYMTLKKNLSIITGSAGTGKSNSLKPLISILQNMNLSVAQTALSGRASSLLSSVTGIEGKTIHRLLKYNAQTGKFNYNKENPMPYDVVILDESSMVGEELFLNLISAVKDGAKFIMLGDIKQLPPLNVGNILSDSLRSGYIDTTVLTKIHRQASQSGIISEAIKVSLGEGIIKNTFQGSEIRGALKDFKIISAADSAVAHYNIIKEFKDLFFGQGIPANQIQIVVPMRSKGDTSCRALNEEIQEIVNPGNLSKSVSVLFMDNGTKYEVRFKKNDRIIINKNNYHAIGVDGKEHAVFNGNLGYIKDIQKDIIIIKLEEEEQDLMFSREDWYNLNLAYAITVHKIQGSQAPYVIIGIDYSAYALLSRELVYTALTRASKYCVLVAQPKALNLAVHTSAIKNKITWLKDDLMAAMIEENMERN